MTVEEVIGKIESDNLELTAEVESQNVADLEIQLMEANKRIEELESEISARIDEYKGKVLALLRTMTSEAVEEAVEETVEEAIEESPSEVSDAEVIEMLKGD